jgi:small subunit ribosomal protein S5
MMMAFRGRRRERRPEEKEPFNIDAWQPKSEMGRKVKAREITNIDEIFESGKPILEHEIVDALVPTVKDEVLEIKMTARMTDSGRKFAYRAIVLVGDENGHAGIGAGKAAEAKPAVESAIKYAKRNIVRIPLGCGSWECGCGTRHTLPITRIGRNGSVHVTIKPAPKGLGIAASEVVKKVLRMAGVRDAWTFSRGRTRNIYNTAMATLDALDSLNRMKFKGEWETRLAETEKKAEAKGETNA